LLAAPPTSANRLHTGREQSRRRNGVPLHNIVRDIDHSRTNVERARSNICSTFFCDLRCALNRDLLLALALALNG
jgi:hypothetical protein